MMWIKAVQQWTTTVKGSSKTAHQNWSTLGPSLHRAPLGQHFDETSLLKTTFVQEVCFCFVFCFGSPTDRRHQNKNSKLNTLFLFVPLLLLANQDRVPSDTQFAHLWRTRTDFHPLQVCPVRGVDPVNLLVRSVFTLWSFVLCVSSKKCEFLPFTTKHLCPCSRKQICINIKITFFSSC